LIKKDLDVSTNDLIATVQSIERTIKHQLAEVIRSIEADKADSSVGVQCVAVNQTKPDSNKPNIFESLNTNITQV
jgi:hypothetical protein